ncbi:hypothetical protein [Streptococcus hyointestinalis]|uniref:hypothetical protein n=1 Tax=Streptococcus hyointestinalis TaxID=1337 RepID=UPI0013DFD686|nr:hypothetical protein [Streptococcus hyointestinalis]
MLNNLEIVMDIDTLEIFEVIDLDEQDNVNTAEEDASEEKQSIPHDDLDNIYLGNSYYYKYSCFLWKVVKDDIVQALSLENKHGIYSYRIHARDGTFSC